jgi:hypothetical protein
MVHLEIASLENDLCKNCEKRLICEDSTETKKTDHVTLSCKDWEPGYPIQPKT